MQQEEDDQMYQEDEYSQDNGEIDEDYQMHSYQPYPFRRKHKIANEICELKLNMKGNGERIKERMFEKDEGRRRRIDLLIQIEDAKLIPKLPQPQHLIDACRSQIKVDFPYKPYSVQTEFVQVMTEAIIGG